MKFKTVGYKGSKRKLLEDIEKLVAEVDPTTVLDGFSGSGIVSAYLRSKGYFVFANDKMSSCNLFSRVFLYGFDEAKVKAVYELSSLTRIMQEQDINLPTDPFLSRSRKQFKDLNQSYKVSKENKEWFIESLRAEDYKLIDYIRNQSYYIP